jgi:hypothetical protein
MRQLIGILLLVLCTGCASIINGTTQKVPITSTPENATVTATGGEMTLRGTTPCTLDLKRKHHQTLTISAPGYKTTTVQLQSVLSGAVAGNIIAGGLIGWGVDAATGGDSKLVPETVSVTLAPEPALVEQTGPTLEKAEALEKDLKRLEELLASGTITQEEYRELRQKTVTHY